jgi:ornithine carbamoyltransferase
MGKDILSVLDMRENLGFIIAESLKMKSEHSKKIMRKNPPFVNKTFALVFEKPSLRTKASFAVAINQLGGATVFMGPDEVQVGKRESASDVGKVLSRYFDGIVYRGFSHENVVNLAEGASIPVINALDDLEHPCQAVADLMTLNEKKGVLKGKKLAYVGDSNNVCNSLLLACAVIGMDMSVASPTNYQPKQEIMSQVEKIASSSGAKIEVLTNPFKAVDNADVVYTDVWVSMGQESEREAKEKLMLPYQVSQKLMNKAKPDALFMHCMPAHRGLEVLPEVIDGDRSIVFDQAENRLHAHKAILELAMQ